MLLGDSDVLVETLPMASQWFAFVVPRRDLCALSSPAASRSFGVFQVTGDALLLLGVASPTSGATQVLLTYDPPVVVLSFPIHAGGSWQTPSVVSSDGIEAYTGELLFTGHRSRGSLITPLTTFPVFRIGTTPHPEPSASW